MRATELKPEQKTILITGCSSGIGRHCAISLHKKGYRVFATARKAEDVAQLQALGLTALELDLSSSDSIKSAVKQIFSMTGHQLFALFNNAGFAQPGAIEDISRDAIRAQFETNVFGTLELTNAVLPIMRRQGYGRIIQNSSVLGFISLPFRGAYNASKYALEGLTDTLRLELNSTAIKVSLIEPGPIASNFRSQAYSQFIQNINLSNSPFRALYASISKHLENSATHPPFTLGPEAVEKALLHALEAKRPKIRYYVTFPTHLFSFLKRSLSHRLLDKILLRAAGDEAKQLITPP
jgi:NAD(P)-dependent dehydrogenase (short-subunit alcohol dehydrogenase family)